MLFIFFVYDLLSFFPFQGLFLKNEKIFLFNIFYTFGDCFLKFLSFLLL